MVDDDPVVEIIDKGDVELLDEEADAEDELISPEEDADVEDDDESIDEEPLIEDDEGDEPDYYLVSDGEEEKIVEVFGIPEEREAMLKELREKHEKVEKTVKPGSEEETFKVDANIPDNPKEPSGWLQKGKDLIAVMAMDGESDEDAMKRVSADHPGYNQIKGPVKPEV